MLIIFALSISEKLPNPLLTVASIFKILVQILLINDVLNHRQSDIYGCNPYGIGLPVLSQVTENPISMIFE